MSDAIKRGHQRVPCDVKAAVYRGVALGRRLGEGRLLDVSLSGAYFLYDAALERNTPYRLEAESHLGPISLPFRLVREGPRTHPKMPGSRHYGLLFNLSADQERQLRVWVDWLRRHPPILEESPFDRTLRSYWEL